MSKYDIDEVVRRHGKPTLKLKFIKGVLHQMYELYDNQIYSNNPYYYHWLPVESEE